MRLWEFLSEGSPYRDTDLPLSNYRGSYDPRSDDLEPYGKEYDEASDLWDLVDDILENGGQPKLQEVEIDKLLATQDWLSTEPGDGAMWEDFKDFPVVLDHDNQRFILDGHNRISKARRKGQTSIWVYYFSA